LGLVFIIPEFLGDWDECLRISFTPRLGRVHLFWGIDVGRLHYAFLWLDISGCGPL
jgi:hypothetical protein